MDAKMQEKFLAMQTEQLQRQQAIAQQMEALRQQAQDDFQKQQQLYTQFQLGNLAADGAGGVGAAAGGAGGAGGAGAAAGSAAGGGTGHSADAQGPKVGKKLKMSALVELHGDGKAAAVEDETETPANLLCDFPGCKHVFKMCATLAACKTNHYNKYHAARKGACVCVCA